nr:30S ribosome-binding factor RbfA [Oceanococcus sp. HetDA_MAG_MS8]
MKHSGGGRPRRFAEELQRSLAMILQRGVGDPRLTLLTITEIDVSPDFANATVRVSHLDPNADLDEAVEALRKAGSHLRHELAQQVHARRVPRLHFVADRLQEKAFALEAKLRASRAQSPADPQDPTDPE